MPSKSNSSAQAAKLKKQLSKLKSLGLYSGDLRRKPDTKAKNAAAKFADVLAGKAAVVKPDKPGRYRGIYPTTKSGLVIVPRRKGERVRVDKEGEIISTRKVGGRTVTSRGKTVKRGDKIEQPKAEERVQYVIPFNAAGGGTNWVRFPNFDELQKFMAGYNYKSWKDYVIVEKIDDPLDDDELDERLERKRKGRRIKGGIREPRKPAKKAAKKKGRKR